MGEINLHAWRHNKKVFLVWQPEAGETLESARRVRAADEEEAAEDWAESYDSDGDYTIVGGSDATVLVREESDASALPHRFIVSGESVPEYMAREAPLPPTSTDPT